VLALLHRDAEDSRRAGEPQRLRDQGINFIKHQKVVRKNLLKFHPKAVSQIFL
jgi:hypothetical protein